MNPVIVITGTIFKILFSWFLSLKHRRYHGIPRFFAFESVFILVMLNLKVWFTDPFSWNQVISWILLVSSIYPVVSGYLLLKRKGKPGMNFEDTSHLVKSGIYGLIRHPLYLSIFLFGAGVVFKEPGRIQIILGFITLIAVYITARVEETEMTQKFGDEYRLYMNETKMFIPFVF